MKTTGKEGRSFYEQFVGKRVFIKCTDEEPGKACDYLNAKVDKVDDDSITITDPFTKEISFDKVIEIGEQRYAAGL